MSFQRVCCSTSQLAGSPTFFIVSLVLSILWLAAGGSWSDLGATAGVFTWHLSIIILYSQNIDTRALQLKLDELVHVTPARDEFAGIEKQAK